MSDSEDSEIRLYDFRQSKRITASLRERLQVCQEQLAEAIAKRLGEGLGVACEATAGEIAEGASDRRFATPFDPVFSFAPLDRAGMQVLFHLEASLAQAFIERMLGGLGAKREVNRAASQIEVGLLQILLAPIRDIVTSTLSSLPNSDRSPRYLGVPEHHEMAPQEGIEMTFEVKTPDAQGGVTVFCSHLALSAELTQAADAVAPADEGKITLKEIESIRVPLQVRWPAAPMQLRQLASLRVGDVIHLDQKLGDEIEITIGGRSAFWGHMGAVDDAFGVQVTRAVASIR